MLEWTTHFNKLGLVIQSTKDKSLKGVHILWQIGNFYIGYTRNPILED